MLPSVNDPTAYEHFNLSRPTTTPDPSSHDELEALRAANAALLAEKAAQAAQIESLRQDLAHEKEESVKLLAASQQLKTAFHDELTGLTDSLVELRTQLALQTALLSEENALLKKGKKEEKTRHRDHINNLTFLLKAVTASRDDDLITGIVSALQKPKQERVKQLNETAHQLQDVPAHPVNDRSHIDDNRALPPLATKFHSALNTQFGDAEHTDAESVSPP